MGSGWCITSIVRPCSSFLAIRVSGPEADAIRNAWQAIDVPQCGYCQAGQIMSAISLLQAKPTPSDDDIDLAMNGNICRCATYVRIRRAIKSAAKEIKS